MEFVKAGNAHFNLAYVVGFTEVLTTAAEEADAGGTVHPAGTRYVDVKLDTSHVTTVRVFGGDADELAEGLRRAVDVVDLDAWKGDDGESWKKG